MARPDNPNSYDKKNYSPIYVRPQTPAHPFWNHKGVNLHRRINSQGSSVTEGNGYQGTDLEDGDVMKWDEDNAEWVPSPFSSGGGTVDMQNHSHQSEENGDGGYVPLITE